MLDEKLRALHRLVRAVKESYTAEIAALEDLKAAEQIEGWIRNRAATAFLAVGESGETYAQAAEQRNALVALIAGIAPGMTWKALNDVSGQPTEPGIFLAGIETLSGSIVFSLPLSLWDALRCPSINKARESVTGDSTSEAVLRLAKNGCLPY